MVKTSWKQHVWDQKEKEKSQILPVNALKFKTRKTKSLVSLKINNPSKEKIIKIVVW
jgi:hypothetical protein